ncbi:MAG TPA: glycosyltransferase family 87 protein [Acidisarcina sp.]
MASMKPSLSSHRFVPQYILALIAICLVAGSVYYSGVYKDARFVEARSKDIDTRYFYVAAKCWATGKSPYEPLTYDTMFQSTFGIHTPAQFVAYLPTLMLVVLPMAPFKWLVAAKIFSLMNFAAAMALFWACYTLVREMVGEPLSSLQWFWVVIASTIGGVTGTIVTGQTSVFVTAACAVALAGCRTGRAWLIVIGIVIATSKPHLSGPVLLFIFIFEPKMRRATWIAMGIVAGVFAYAAAVDRNLVTSYLNAMHTYAALPINDASHEIGLVSLLMRYGLAHKPAQVIGMLSLLLVMALTAWVIRRSGQTLTRSSLGMMLLIFATGVGQPLQGYDLCAYAVGVALIGTVDLPCQMLLALPALLIWRQTLLDLLHLYKSNNSSRTLSSLTLLLITIIIAAWRLLSRPALRVHSIDLQRELSQPSV